MTIPFAEISINSSSPRITCAEATRPVFFVTLSVATPIVPRPCGRYSLSGVYLP